MRRNMFAVAAVALLAMAAAPVSMADAPYPPAKKIIPTATCSVSGIEVDAKGILRVMGVKCLAKVKMKDGSFKPVPILAKVIKVTYTAKDAQANTCGSMVVKLNTGRFATVPLGPASMTATITVVPRNKRFKQVGKKIYALRAKIAPSVATARCGETRQNTPLPDPLTLCPNPIYRGCGSPVDPSTGQPAPEAHAWVTAPSMAGNVISAGRFVPPNGSSGGCWIQPRASRPSFPWLGFTVSTAESRCADGTHVEIAMYRVTMTNPLGEICGPYAPPFVEIASFRVPPQWGGLLEVKWTVETTRKGETLGVESATATFNLSGSADGCPQLRAESRS